MLNDPLAAALSKIFNAERVGQRDVMVRPASVMLKRVLSLLKEHHYLGSFDETKDDQGGLLKVNLLGSINKCGVIKPRFSSKYTEFEKWEKRYLPAKDFGLIIVSTPQGILTHYEAKEKKIGGRLIAFCY